MSNRSIQTLSAVLLVTMALAATPDALAAKARSAVKTSTPAPTASTSTIMPVMPTIPSSAPVANVYDTTTALPQNDTRDLTALAAILAILGMLVLQEDMLRSLIRFLSRRKKAREPQPYLQPRHFGMGGRAPAQ